MTRAQLETVLAQANAEAPRECCGLLLGTGDVVAAVLPARNSAAELPEPRDPRVYYHVDDRTQLDAIRLERERGWEVIGIYHSHPASAARPSETDRALAFWQTPYYVIVSLADASRPDIRAFRITDRTDEHGVPVSDAAGRPVRDVVVERVVVTRRAAGNVVNEEVVAQ
jgi:proteasome lid subunit RPN8/RPN11